MQDRRKNQQTANLQEIAMRGGNFGTDIYVARAAFRHYHFPNLCALRLIDRSGTGSGVSMS